MFFDAALDDSEALGSIDPVLREIAMWGADVRRACIQAADTVARLGVGDRPRAVIAAGPRGRFLRAVLEPSCPVPLVAWSHAGLPGWAGPLDLVVVMCPGGTGDDDVSAVAEARRRGCSLLVAAPEGSTVHEAADGRGTVLVPVGSADPTATTVPVLKALHVMGLGASVDGELVASALDDVAGRCGPSVPTDVNPAKELALAVADDIPVLWGGSMLSARAARRIAELLRSASGRPVVAGSFDQIAPMLEAAPASDLFADPFEDAVPASARPVLVVVDDGADLPSIAPTRALLDAAAGNASVRIQEVRAVEGPDFARFAALLATGRFAAAYLALGLGRPA